MAIKLIILSEINKLLVLVLSGIPADKYANRALRSFAVKKINWLILFTKIENTLLVSVRAVVAVECFHCVILPDCVKYVNSYQNVSVIYFVEHMKQYSIHCFHRINRNT